MPLLVLIRDDDVDGEIAFRHLVVDMGALVENLVDVDLHILSINHLVTMEESDGTRVTVVFPFSNSQNHHRLQAPSSSRHRDSSRAMHGAASFLYYQRQCVKTS